MANKPRNNSPKAPAKVGSGAAQAPSAVSLVAAKRAKKESEKRVCQVYLDGRLLMVADGQMANASRLVNDILADAAGLQGKKNTKKNVTVHLADLQEAAAALKLEVLEVAPNQELTTADVPVNAVAWMLKKGFVLRTEGFSADKRTFLTKPSGRGKSGPVKQFTKDEIAEFEEFRRMKAEKAAREAEEASEEAAPLDVVVAAEAAGHAAEAGA